MELLAPTDIQGYNYNVYNFPWNEYPEQELMYGKKKKKKSNRIKEGINGKHSGWCISSKGRPVKVYKVLKKSGKGFKKGKYYSSGKKVPKSRPCRKTKAKLVKLYRNSRKRKYYSRYKFYYIYDLVPRKSGSNKSTQKHSDVKKTLRNYPTQDAVKSGKKGYKLPCGQYSYSSCGKVGNSVGRCKWENNRCRNSFGLRKRRNNFGFAPNKFNYQLTQYGTNAGTPTINQMGNLSGKASYDYPMNSRMRNYRYYHPKDNYSGYGF